MADEDLELAAGKALGRLSALEARVHHAQESLAATRQQVEQARAQVEDDWQALTRQFDAFIRAVDEAEAGLQEDGDEAAQATAAAVAEMAGAQEAVPQVAAAAEALGAWGGQVEARALAVSQRTGEAQVAYQGLAQRAAAVEQQLAAALGDARDFLHGEVLTDLAQMQQAVEQGRAEIHGAVGECEGDLDAAADGWRHGLDALRVAVDRAFDDVGRHAPRAVKEAMAGLAQGQRAGLEDLSRQAETLAQALWQLAEAATARSVDVGDALGALEKEAGAAAEALETMQDRLSEVRELLARFSFVSF